MVMSSLPRYAQYTCRDRSNREDYLGPCLSGCVCVGAYVCACVCTPAGTGPTRGWGAGLERQEGSSRFFALLFEWLCVCVCACVGVWMCVHTCQAFQCGGFSRVAREALCRTQQSAGCEMGEEGEAGGEAAKAVG